MQQISLAFLWQHPDDFGVELLDNQMELISEFIPFRAELAQSNPNS